jgi:hypothetical protein
MLRHRRAPQSIMNVPSRCIKRSKL